MFLSPTLRRPKNRYALRSRRSGGPASERCDAAAMLSTAAASTRQTLPPGARMSSPSPCCRTDGETSGFYRSTKRTAGSVNGTRESRDEITPGLRVRMTGLQGVARAHDGADRSYDHRVRRWWPEHFRSATNVAEEKEANAMSARTPEECDTLFERHLNAGDLDALVGLYEPGATLVMAPGEASVDHA